MIILLIALILSCNAVFAQTYVFSGGDDMPAIMPHIQSQPEAPQLNPLKAKKSFAERHPKLHKIGRRFRQTCQVLVPIVSVGGSVAQILSMCHI